MYRHCVPAKAVPCSIPRHSPKCLPQYQQLTSMPAIGIVTHRSVHVLHGHHWGLASHPPRQRPRIVLSDSRYHAQRDALQTTEDPPNNNGTPNNNAITSNMFQAALSSLDLPGGSSLDSMDVDDMLASMDGSSDDNAHHEHHHSAAAVGRAVYEVLRIDPNGKTRRIYVRRRDLLRGYCLQPRDLRRIDPSLTPTKTSPSVTIKEQALLVNMGGVRAIISAGKCLLFEPNSSSSRRFLELVTPRLQTNAGG